jgi:benzoyl-CoA reductase/2-hydroxyglutaryl-CoA dehydratase subunit BcrC/BadD/HgdB
MPKEEHSKILRNMLDNIGSRREKEKKVRLFFSGGALDQENATLYRIIEESVDKFVSEDKLPHQFLS